MTTAPRHMASRSIAAERFWTASTSAGIKILMIVLLFCSIKTIEAQDEVENFEENYPELSPQQFPDEGNAVNTVEEIAEEEYFEEDPTPRVAEELNEKPVWSDEKWQEAIKETRYEKEPQKEKEPEEIKPEEFEEKNYTENIDISEWLRGIFLSDMAKIICIVLIVVMLTMLILYLTKARLKSGKLKLQQQVGELPDLDEEHIPESDLERYLRVALEKSDFKTAVRVLYLMTIQQLNSGSLIQWKKDKTNSDYLLEMRKQSHYGEFKQLTILYEVVWYGDRSVNAREFDIVRKSFDQYQRQLNSVHEA
jgi:hypothetical protein